MSEYNTQLAPFERLEREVPEVIKSSIIVGIDGCFCGNCKIERFSFDIEELDRCSNIDCGTGWQRTLLVAKENEIPAHKYRLPAISAQGMLDRKLQPQPASRASFDAPRSRPIATVALNSNVL